LKFQAIGEKTANKILGNTFAAPCISLYRSNWNCQAVAKVLRVWSSYFSRT